MPLHIAQSGDLDRCYQCLTHWQTLKDRATQLLIKYKSGALITQFSPSNPTLGGTANCEQISAYKCLSPAGGEEEEIWKRKTRDKVVTVIATFSLDLSIQICKEGWAKTGSNWIHWERLKFGVHCIYSDWDDNFWQMGNKRITFPLLATKRCSPKMCYIWWVSASPQPNKEIKLTLLFQLHHISCSYCQGGRTWQPFVRSKNGHETFRQARTYNFRNKCVVFARNRKFANLTQ